MKYFSKLKDYIIRLSKKGLSPNEIAFGIALGTFVGCMPVIGTHTIVAIGLAHLLRLNVLIVLLGTQISNPITIPFQFFISAEVGSLILNGKFLKIVISREINYFDHYLMPILVGSLVLGVVVSGFSFLLIKFFLKRKRKTE